MARGKRGGSRTPARPAAVSGVGAASARTDGGPAKVPVVANGQPYGVRGQTEALAGAAPMGGEGSPPPSAQGAPPRQVQPGPMPDMFGPSQMPPGGRDVSVPPANEILRAMYEVYPSPWIASLIGDDF